MRLRLRIIVWILPVFLPLAVYNSVQYAARVAALREGLRRNTVLAAEVAASRLNDFLIGSLEAFHLLQLDLPQCGATVEGASLTVPTPQQVGRIDSALKRLGMFSLMALIGHDSRVLYTQFAQIPSNRDILPKPVEGIWQDDTHILHRNHREYLRWLEQLPGFRREQAELDARLSALAAGKQRDTLLYRDLVRRHATLSNLINEPPITIGFGGAALAARAGLPFSSHSFLFLSVLEDCGGHSDGHVLAVMDWLLVERLLVEMGEGLRRRGLSSVQLALFDRQEERFLSAPPDIDPVLTAVKNGLNPALNNPTFLWDKGRIWPLAF